MDIALINHIGTDQFVAEVKHGHKLGHRDDAKRIIEKLVTDEDFDAFDHLVATVAIDTEDGRTITTAGIVELIEADATVFDGQLSIIFETVWPISWKTISSFLASLRKKENH